VLAFAEVAPQVGGLATGEVDLLPGVRLKAEDPHPLAAGPPQAPPPRPRPQAAEEGQADGECRQRSMRRM